MVLRCPALPQLHAAPTATYLCCPVLQVLNASTKPDLIRATLSTLHAFLSWVPLGYIFESNVTEVWLLTSF